MCTGAGDQPGPVRKGTMNATTSIAASNQIKTRTERFMVGCNCRTVRVSFRRIFRVQLRGMYKTPHAVEMGTHADDVERSDAFYSLVVGRRCVTCGVSFSIRQIEGRKSAHKCDARCTEAQGHKCECECGGKNHGAGFDL